MKKWHLKSESVDIISQNIKLQVMPTKWSIFSPLKCTQVEKSVISFQTATNCWEICCNRLYFVQNWQQSTNPEVRQWYTLCKQPLYFFLQKPKTTNKCLNSNTLFKCTKQKKHIYTTLLLLFYYKSPWNSGFSSRSSSLPQRFIDQKLKQAL